MVVFLPKISKTSTTTPECLNGSVRFPASKKILLWVISFMCLISWIKQVTRFPNPSCSSSNSKNWLNAVLFTIFNFFSQTQRFEFRYFFKNHVNHAFLVGFGQNKAQKWQERVYFRSRTSYVGGLRSLRSSKYGFFIILGAGQVTVTKEVWTYFTRQTMIWVHLGLKLTVNA